MLVDFRGYMTCNDNDDDNDGVMGSIIMAINNCVAVTVFLREKKMIISQVTVQAINYAAMFT